MILDFKETLGNRGKVFVGNSKMTNALSYADEYTLTPLAKDDSYVDFLLTYCQANHISAILPSRDIELAVLAKNKKLFKKQGITLILSDESAIQLCSDKWKTYQFLLSLGLKQPKSYIDLNFLKKDILCGKISFPIFIKPRWGAGSRGIYQAYMSEELDVLYQKSKKDIFNSAYNHEHKAEENACIIMQEKIEGVEHGLDVLNDLNGNYIATSTRRKYFMKSGISQTVQIVDNKYFEDIGKLISSQIKCIGPLSVDCFLTKTNEIVVLELNCRFGGEYTYTHLAGANFPRQIVEWLLGKPTSNDNITIKVGIKGAMELGMPVRI